MKIIYHNFIYCILYHYVISLIVQNTITTLDTVREIYLTIKTRGPYAFENLLLSLRQSDHGNIADILQEKTNANNIRYILLLFISLFFFLI